MSDCCRGNCCAVFSCLTPPGHLRARWANVSRPLTQLEAERERDDLYIADMLVPLSQKDVKDRYAEFDFQPREVEGVDLVKFAAGELDWKPYTCAHWSPETKRCTAYEERPRMCADYPYGRPCTLDAACNYESPPERSEDRSAGSNE